MVRWTLKIIPSCLLMAALCSALPFRRSMRDKQTKFTLKQRRTGTEIPAHEYLLIMQAIEDYDDNHDGLIDQDEFEIMFLAMNPDTDIETAQYLANEMFGNKAIPIPELAVQFSTNDFGIF
ncbi:uncharacterized protein [Argopecten irradians]|uniref:uncharacterized protein n=1 Tax=Argopecten irradians TaxID=31199 RepID=UPI0037171DE3